MYICWNLHSKHLNNKAERLMESTLDLNNKFCDGDTFSFGKELLVKIVRALASHQCVPDPASYVGWLSSWFSTYTVPRGSNTGTPVFPYTPLESSLIFRQVSKTNISKFQFDLGMHRHFWTNSCELLDPLWVNKLLYFTLLRNTTEGLWEGSQWAQLSTVILPKKCLFLDHD